VKTELDQRNIVILAGFQGVCPETKDVTTLGRGGSDTTAVAMASHFKAKCGEFLKDVDGAF
jgi:aspartate kinase